MKTTYWVLGIAAAVMMLCLVAIIIGKVLLARLFKERITELRSGSKDISAKCYSIDQLCGLPAPVQRYFSHVLQPCQPYISWVAITHTGHFKTGLKADWVAIEGEQYFSIDNSSFIWKGTTSLFTAFDMYVNGHGNLVVYLLSLVKIVNGKGPKYDQGELLRWLSESVWFPTNLLPSQHVRWEAIDTHSAILHYRYNNLALQCLVNFAENGEIMSLQTQRYMDELREETWLAKAATYKRHNNILVPTRLEAMWRLPEGDVPYARFELTSIVYDQIPTSK